MPYFDAEGKEVEGLVTPEDAKAAQEAAVTAAQDAAQEASTTKEGELQTKIDDLNKQIGQAGGKPGDANSGDKGGGGTEDENLANLRKKVETAEEALKTEQTTNNQRWGAVQGEQVTQEISKAANNDEEMALKIKHHFDTTLSGVTAATPAQIAEKVSNAAKLAGATEQVTVDPLSAAAGGGSRGAAPASTQANTNEARKMSSNEIDIGNKMGINDADREKYGKDPRLNTK